MEINGLISNPSKNKRLNLQKFTSILHSPIKDPAYSSQVSLLKKSDSNFGFGVITPFLIEDEHIHTKSLFDNVHRDSSVRKVIKLPKIEY